MEAIDIENLLLNNDEKAKHFAKENLNETNEHREKCLEEIRKWLTEDQAKLHARMEDQYLLPFLRGCKYNMEKTKKKLVNYYTMRRNVPEWFQNRNPELKEIQDLMKLGVFVPLTKLQDNKLVVIVRTAIHDPCIHTQDNVFKTGNMMMDVASLENIIPAQIYGVIAIFDLYGMDFDHAKEFTPSMIKKAVFCWQNYHVRPKNLEFINAPPTINVILSIFKSFMSEKLKNRIKVHTDGYEKLYEVVSKDILPPEYGGHGETMEELIKYWNGVLLKYKTWFLDDEMYKSD
ncbi:retinol-binding protein pinta-like [Diorhabda carinulata]|uniref:retinol-binding protein pinta-like n=1 Tax=Diorhabda carinulata TaxID=1163345 RepID=UPI0025A1FD6E|nr:retinol-binding protein pinta-like [Diorhabda carinulata]